MKYLNKIIEYGLYLLVFVLPWQTRWIIKPGETEYLTYSLYGVDVILILLLLLFIVREIALLPRPDVRTPRHDIIIWLVIGLLAVAGVSVFFAVDKTLALYKFGWLVLGAGLFYLASRADYNRAKLIGSFLSAIFFQAGLGIYQFFSQSAFANKWLGLAAHRAADLGTAVVETVGADGIGERWLRAYGGQDHPNVLAGLMVIGIILAINQIKKIENSSRIKIVYWGAMIFFAAALFFSFSRSGWLALAIGLTAGIILNAVKKDLKTQKVFLQSLLLISIIGFILFGQYGNLVTTRLNREGRLENISTSERIASVKNAWLIVKNNWPIGTGPGNYVLALKRTLPAESIYFYQPVHNVVILILAEVGVIGWLFFIAALIFLLVRNFSSDTLALLGVLLILMNLDHWLWSLHFGILFFWLSLGLINREGGLKTLPRVSAS